MQPRGMHYYSSLLLIPPHLPSLTSLPRPVVFEVIVFVEDSVKELNYWSLPVSVAASLPRFDFQMCSGCSAQRSRASLPVVTRCVVGGCHLGRLQTAVGPLVSLFNYRGNTIATAQDNRSQKRFRKPGRSSWKCVFCVCTSQTLEETSKFYAF